MFANFFKSIYSLDDCKIPILPNFHTKMNDDIIFDIVTIGQYLNVLLNKFSVGPDGIPTILLKKLAAKLSLPLSLFFSNIFCLRSKNEWKQTNVASIFKDKGSKHIIDNYRPISLTSSSCKVMESIIHKTLLIIATEIIF